MSRWRLIIKKWAELTVYQRFEGLVAVALSLLVTGLILITLLRLYVDVGGGLMAGAVNPLERASFHEVFGDIMTLLIALEFNHTIMQVANQQQPIIQTKVVLMIAMLALARKVIIIDLNHTSAEMLLGMAAMTVALGATYWLMRDRDERSARKLIEPTMKRD